MADQVGSGLDDGAAHDPGRNDQRRWLGLGVVLTAVFMALMDSFIANVVAPKIRADLDMTVGQIALVVGGLSVVFAGCFVLVATLGRPSKPAPAGTSVAPTPSGPNAEPTNGPAGGPGSGPAGAPDNGPAGGPGSGPAGEPASGGSPPPSTVPSTIDTTNPLQTVTVTVPSTIVSTVTVPSTVKVTGPPTVTTIFPPTKQQAPQNSGPRVGPH